MSQDGPREAAISLLAGIAVGALVGAAAALLLAPQSGTDTRTQIRDRADDVLDRVRTSLDDLRVKVDEVVTQTRDNIARRGEPDTPQGDVAPANDFGMGTG